ncbi:hypothetical protein QR77_24730 [Streptomyces sp. 150FB]|uniref:DUF397 domain-containing protein n=1 Tax=Streptomyces sp. 150FB TaxID=1576605 RepID=UPI000589523D|nr:DUF397 domain-containing protein [Streptomyces sp. 150FB]KIF76230.1 hypothetical protein QR77_24730 [Streptomyces sp. 150FB]
MSNTPDLTNWVKSTYSGGQGNCVEWSPTFAQAHGTVPVRDSKTKNGPVLMLTPTAFAGLIALARTHA